MTKPFEGLRVVEFGRYVAGPYAAEQFANGGADVIKIEEIEGDETRRNSEILPGEGRQFIIKARGKRDIALNVATPEGADVARKIIASSDIVISNMRPGVLDRLGIGYEAMSAEHPRVIYAEISGFGDAGPNRDRASIDAVMQAVSGLMNGNRSSQDGRPVMSEAFLCDYMAAMTLSFGIMIALRERDRTGKGQRVTTSLLDAALALQHGTASIFDAVDSWKRNLVEAAAAPDANRTQLIENRREWLAGNRWFYNTYATSDGFITVAGPGRHRKTLLRILEIDDPAVTQPGWVMPDDPRPYLEQMYANAAASVARWATEDLLDALTAEGIPCAPIRFLEEVLLDPATDEAGLLQHFDHPVVGPVTMPAASLRFSDSTYEVAETSPAYGEHTLDILREAGFSSDDLLALVRGGIAGTPDTSPFN